MGWKLEDAEDLGRERGECSWGHSDLRHLFHVVNTDTDEKLHLGSDCYAKHFQEICDRDLREDDEPRDNDQPQQVQQQRVQQQQVQQLPKVQKLAANLISNGISAKYVVS